MYPHHYEHPLTRHRGPLVPGHEFAGHVARVGDGIEPMLEGRAGRIKTIVDPWTEDVRATVTPIHFEPD